MDSAEIPAYGEQEHHCPRLAHRSSMHRRTPIDPRARLLELRRNANQQVFATDRRHELNPDRETLGSPVQGQRDRGLSR